MALRAGITTNGGIIQRILTKAEKGRTVIVRRLNPTQQQLRNNRSYWQEVVRVRTDKDGKKKYEDPEMVANRFQEQVRSDGEALMDIHAHNDRHEKAWMKKKRLANKKQYEVDKKHVMDLAKYIEFVKGN